MALVIALLLLSLQLASSQSDYGYLNIDCGWEKAYGYVDSNNVTWRPDTYFTKVGYNHKINKSLDLASMNSLRAFPDQNKNCYTLPAFVQQKYLLRAGFNYGNYDGFSRPPTFDLQFDTSLWATVDALALGDGPVFYEAVVVAKGRNISVCLSRTRNGDTPFMSSLEMMQLLPEMYSSMESNRALFKQVRVNFGSNASVRYPDDKYGRIWEPVQTTGYTNITANFDSFNSTVPDDPPPAAILTAIQAPTPTASINLSFVVRQPDRPTYVAIYFTEVADLKPGENRTFDVYLNGQDYNLRVSPRNQRCSEVHGYTDPSASAGPFNLRLAPSQNSNMPPIVSAMELYTVSDVVRNGTALGDVMKLEELSRFTNRLAERWTGDPCLPVAWEWIRCNEENPPRVTSLYLGNYNIEYLPDLTQMQALEIVDLQSNNITGTIPDFLGDLPNLKKLNLANNKLRGIVPESLLSDKLSLNISGNPELVIPIRKNKKNRHLGLIVGLVVGAFGLNCIIIAYFFWRHRGKGKIDTVELSRVQVEPDANPIISSDSVVHSDNMRGPSAEGNEA